MKKFFYFNKFLIQNIRKKIKFFLWYKNIFFFFFFFFKKEIYFL
jgi:hypothetical protein